MERISLAQVTGKEDLFIYEVSPHAAQDNKHATWLAYLHDQGCGGWMMEGLWEQGQRFLGPACQLMYANYTSLITSSKRNARVTFQCSDATYYYCRSGSATKVWIIRQFLSPLRVFP